MKNNQYIAFSIIFIVAVVVVFVGQKLLKMTNKPTFDNIGNRTDWSMGEVEAALKKVANQYGSEYAKNVERLFRIETNHFKSGQFKKTLSPGMEIAGGTNSTKLTFPYGWSSLQKFVSSNGVSKSAFYTVRMAENQTGIGKTFIGFPNVETSVMFVAWFIKNVRNGRFGYWYSLDNNKALSYENNMSNISSKLV